MRIALLLVLLLPSLAAAETRVGLQLAGGFEVVPTKPPRDAPIAALGEVGAAVDRLHEGWGYGITFQRNVGERTREYKADFMFRLRNPRNGFVGGFGLGLRRFEFPAEDLRPGSTMWGADLLRVTAELPLVRFEQSSIDFYFAYSFGLYHGERYADRVGDMPLSVEDDTTITNAYVLGLATSFHTNP